MKNLLKVSNLAVACLSLLFIISCGGSTTSSTSGSKASSSQSSGSKASSSQASAGPVEYPSQPSDCGSDCPPPFPIQ